MDSSQGQAGSYDILALAKRLRRNPRYLADLIRNGGMTPKLAEKVSDLTGMTISELIHRRSAAGAAPRGKRNAGAVSRRQSGGGVVRSADGHDALARAVADKS